MNCFCFNCDDLKEMKHGMKHGILLKEEKYVKVFRNFTLNYIKGN